MNPLWSMVYALVLRFVAPATSIQAPSPSHCLHIAAKQSTYLGASTRMYDAETPRKRHCAKRTVKWSNENGNSIETKKSKNIHSIFRLHIFTYLPRTHTHTHIPECFSSYYVYNMSIIALLVVAGTMALVFSSLFLCIRKSCKSKWLARLAYFYSPFDVNCLRYHWND